LEEIANTTQHSEVSANGHGLLYQMKTFEFFFLEIMHPILQLILTVSKTLKKQDLNLSAMSVVQSQMRNGESFQAIYTNVVSVCESNEIAIPPVKKRKVSSRIDESAGSQYFVQTKEEEMKISCLLDNLQK
jgi:hypothetical protein